MGCTGLNGSVYTMRLREHLQLLSSPLLAKTNGSRNQKKPPSVNEPLLKRLKSGHFRSSRVHHQLVTCRTIKSVAYSHVVITRMWWWSISVATEEKCESSISQISWLHKNPAFHVSCGVSILIIIMTVECLMYGYSVVWWRPFLMVCMLNFSHSATDFKQLGQGQYFPHLRKEVELIPTEMRWWESQWTVS